MVKRKQQSCEESCVPQARPVPVRARTHDDERLAKLAWAIAHPVRIRLLRILLARESCVCGELAGEFELAQSTVSQHLKILKEAELIQGEIDGPKVCYCVNPPVLAQLKQLTVAI